MRDYQDTITKAIDKLSAGEVTAIVLTGMIIFPLCTPFVVAYTCYRIHKNKGY